MNFWVELHLIPGGVPSFVMDPPLPVLGKGPLVGGAHSRTKSQPALQRHRRYHCEHVCTCATSLSGISKCGVSPSCMASCRCCTHDWQRNMPKQGLYTKSAVKHPRHIYSSMISCHPNGAPLSSVHRRRWHSAQCCGWMRGSLTLWVSPPLQQSTYSIQYILYTSIFTLTCYLKGCTVHQESCSRTYCLE